MNQELPKELLEWISAVNSAICNLVPMAIMDGVARDRLNYLCKKGDALFAAATIPKQPKDLTIHDLVAWASRAQAALGPDLDRRIKDTQPEGIFCPAFTHAMCEALVQWMARKGRSL